MLQLLPEVLAGGFKLELSLLFYIPAKMSVTGTKKLFIMTQVVDEFGVPRTSQGSKRRAVTVKGFLHIS